jgi:hypothetical protein
MNFEQSAAFLTALYEEATGQKPTIQIANTADFISVGTTLLQGSIDPIAVGLVQLLDRTVFSMRVYGKKFADIIMNEQLWGAVTQKVNYLDTPLDSTDDRLPMTDGTSLDPWVIKKPKIMTELFYGATVHQDSITIMRDQLNSALRNPDEFARFISGVMTNIANKHKQIEEEQARACLINFITAKYSVDSANAINVLQAYYDETGTTLTPANMFAPANYVEFTRWLAAFMQTLVDKMGERSIKFHMNVTGKEIMRFTEPENMRKYISDKVLNNIVAVAQSVTYNDEKIGNIAEGANKVTYWQNINDPYTVDATPSYLNTTTGAIDTAQSDVKVENIIGVLFDRDALGITKRSTWSGASPFNPRGGYYNLFYHWTETMFNSFTENFVLLYADTVTP